jgi:hypothetical protein
MKLFKKKSKIIGTKEYPSKKQMILTLLLINGTVLGTLAIFSALIYIFLVE